LVLKEALGLSAIAGLVLALVGTAFLASLDIATSGAAEIAGGLFGALGYSF
jgi:hypothetical protein